MPENPTYGAIYDATIPTPSVNGITSWGNGYSNFKWGTKLVVPTSGAEQRFGFKSANISLSTRIAYQVRKRYSANAVGWDGGESWTEWGSEAGVADAWTELYTTANTPTSPIGDVYGFVLADMNLVTRDYHPQMPYSDVNTYDAIEYRVQCWHINGSGASMKYGSPDVKTIRVDYAPTFAVTAQGSSADDSLKLTLAVSNWGRGAQLYSIGALTFSPTGGDVTIKRSNSSSTGVFKYPAELVGEYVKSSGTVAVQGIVYPVGSSASFAYTVGASIAAWNPDGTAVTQPVVEATDLGGAYLLTIADSTYDRVSVTVSWNGGGYETEATKSGADWTALVCPPFNTEATWVVMAYDTVGGVEYYNKSNGTFTAVGYGYELRADDGRAVSLVLEAKEQLSTDTDATVTTLASGRQVARHGLGTKRSWTLRGQLLGSSHSAESDWLGDLAILDEPANLTYRNPYGEVARVCVTGWTRSPASVWDVIEVAVSFTEVD